MAVYANRPRVPSHHVRQLTRGRFLVDFKDITLLDCIGEGYIIRITQLQLKSLFLGEFGIVYKARLNTGKRFTQEVAVKTLKGSLC